MKKIKLIILLPIFLITNWGCGDFGDINVDPNKTTEVAPEVLLTSSLQSAHFVADAYFGNLYAQYLSQTTYTLASRYERVNFDFNLWYAYPLINLEEIIRLNTDEATKGKAQISGSNNNQIAVAKILQAYLFHYLTDRWGALPFTESLQGRANFKPVYDSQEDIYRGIFEGLTEAIAMMDTGPTVKGDFLLNGNLDHWKKMANSIKMIAALRLSKVAPDLGKAAFVEAMEGGVLTSNMDNIMYPYLADADNENPFFSRFRNVSLEAISNTLLDRLVVLKDPRLYAYADPSQIDGNFTGMPYGVDNPSSDPASLSLPHSTNVRGQDTPLPLITYSQLLFSMAEAAHLGWIDADAEQLYYDAIQASMEQWQSFDASIYEEYIAQPTVQWNATNAPALLGEQKWIALYLQGYEAWAEWRRTGYPNLQPAPDAINQSRQIPRREGYPTSERDINFDNWKTAVDTWLDGEDGLDGRVWWDLE